MIWKSGNIVLSVVVDWRRLCGNALNSYGSKDHVQQIITTVGIIWRLIRQYLISERLFEINFRLNLNDGPSNVNESAYRNIFLSYSDLCYSNTEKRFTLFVT